MTPVDIIIIAVIVLCVGGAALYIYRAKKSGKKCIGCPDSSSCGKKGRCRECKNTNGGKSCSDCRCDK